MPSGVGAGDVDSTPPIGPSRLFPMLATATESFPLLSLLVGVLLVPLGWRRPTLLFLLALASLAVRPEATFGGA